VRAWSTCGAAQGDSGHEQADHKDEVEAGFEQDRRLADESERRRLERAGHIRPE
jgi:hypothetical protein